MEWIDALSDRMEAVVGLVLAALAILKAIKEARARAASDTKASKLEAATQIVVAGFEALSKALPAAKAKQTKQEITAIAVRAGVEGILNEQVRKTTKEFRAVDLDGHIVPPPSAARLLGALLLTLLLSSGCVAREARETAVLLYQEVQKHNATCEPNEGYFNASLADGYDQPRARAAWETHKSNIEATARKLAEVLE